MLISWEEWWRELRRFPSIYTNIDPIGRLRVSPQEAISRKQLRKGSSCGAPRGRLNGALDENAYRRIQTQSGPEKADINSLKVQERIRRGRSPYPRA